MYQERTKHEVSAKGKAILENVRTDDNSADVSTMSLLITQA